MSGQVTCSVRDQVATIELSNPGKLNAFTWSMYDQLEQSLGSLADDSSVRVVLITGRDQAFAAGTDISQFADFETAEDGLAYEHRVARVLAALLGISVPVIAAVDGPAVGAGLAVAACCDLVIATEEARFGAPIARTLGNCLPPLVVARLQSRLGAGRTMAMLLTASLISAEQAAAAGLVHVVSPRADFAALVDQTVNRIRQGAPVTLAALKEIDRRLDAAAAVEGDDLLARCYGSDDFREGVSAFLEHRRPEWKGR